MRVVESTCHKISIYSRRILSLLPDAVIACCGCIVGMSKRWRGNRSGVRVGVDRRCHDFGHFPAQSGPMEGQVPQLACKLLLQRNGSRVRSIINGSSLETWVRWYLDCTMMYGPKGFSKVWGLSLTRQLTGELGGERLMFEQYTEKARRVVFFARY